MSDRYSELDEVINYIHQHLYDPLPLSRLAEFAGYSPYHFARIFKERTGLPPLYYVSSIRLQKAKDLLLNTTMNIRDIGLEIGQQSLGTFTTRFTERVGITPSDFRNSARQVDHHMQTLQLLDNWRAPRLLSGPHTRIAGSIDAEVPFEGFILIGLFAKPIPEGLPLHGTLLSALGEYEFTGVQPGTYYLMATSVSWEMGAADILLPQATLRARLKQPIIVESDTRMLHRSLTLHLPRLDDPPILISLSVLMNRFLSSITTVSTSY